MKLLIIVVLYSFLFTQSSVIGLTGLGQEIVVSDPANAGAGHIELFSTSVKGASCVTTAQLWRDTSTGLRTMVKFQNLNSVAFSNFFSNGINHISFNFPIGKNKSMQFGLIPKKWVQYSIREEINGDSPVLYYDDTYFRYKSNYYSRGGISSLFGTYSQKVTEFYSFGIQLESVFGNRFQIDSLEVYNYYVDAYGDDIYSLSYATITNSIHHYQGYSIKIDQVFSSSINEFGISINLGGPLNVELQDYFTTGIGQAGLAFKTYNNFYSSGRIGLHTKLRNNFGIIFESELTNWKVMNEEHLIFKTQNPNSLCFNLGSYRHFLNNGNKSIFTSSVRFGLYFKYLKYPIYPIIDYGVTLGSGLLFNRQLNAIDVAITFGQRQFDMYNIKYENYMRLIFGLDIGETWFLNKK